MKKKTGFDPRDIGSRLKAVREALSLTLIKMQEKTGLSKSHISAIEKGEKKPPVVYLFALLDRFNVDLNFIFSGEGNMFKRGIKPGQGTSELGHTFDELVYMIDNVELVRYAMLTEYIKFKAGNISIISELLEKRT